MNPHSCHRTVSAALAVMLCAAMRGHAEKVRMSSVEATRFERAVQGPPSVIDGQDGGRIGWSVFPKVEEKQMLVVRTAAPVTAEAFELTMCFLSGMPKRHFGRFTLSYTTDEIPGLLGNWHRLKPMRLTATGTELTESADGFIVSGSGDDMIGDAVFHVRAQVPQRAVTGFRIEVYPFVRPGTTGPRLAWNQYRDFCLTEFRVEAVLTGTTNIALGCQATASHPLWANVSANLLTDGLPGSFVHPAESGHGADFHFDIDLGSTRAIDHIALRGRADGFGLDRMSRVLVRLYDRVPEPGTLPVWEAMARADGSYPDAGDTDVLRVAESGTRSGRHIRISSDNPVELSPQIAEVETYETITPVLVVLRADGHPIALDSGMRVPAGTSMLTARLDIPGAGLPEKLPLRWRFRGLHQDWLKVQDLAVEISQPPPGDYFLEAQAAHSDGEWDQSVLSIPVAILAPFWQTPLFFGLTGTGGAGLVVLLGFAAARRRRARELAEWGRQTALVEERRRIARDMHDEVGGRLSQLALMQDLIIRKHPLPDEARASLEQLAANTRSTVDALDQVVWAVNPLHDSLAGVAEYLSYLATSYLAPLGVNCRLDVPFDWPGIKVRAQVRHEITLAFREALQNIVKHADARTATLCIRYDAPMLMIRLSDDGRGLSGEITGPGRDGIANMRSRLASIRGTCAVTGLAAGGASVEMLAPLSP